MASVKKKKTSPGQKTKRDNKVFVLIPVPKQKDTELNGNGNKDDAISLQFSSLKYDQKFMNSGEISKPKPSILRRNLIPSKTTSNPPEIFCIGTGTASNATEIETTPNPKPALFLRKIATIPAEAYRDLLGYSPGNFSSKTFTDLKTFPASSSNGQNSCAQKFLPANPAGHPTMQQQLKLQDGRTLTFCGSIAMTQSQSIVANRSTDFFQSLQNFDRSRAKSISSRNQSKSISLNNLIEQNIQYHNYASSAPRLRVESPVPAQDLIRPNVDRIQAPNEAQKFSIEEPLVEIDLHLESTSEIPFSIETEFEIGPATAANEQESWSVEELTEGSRISNSIENVVVSCMENLVNGSSPSTSKSDLVDLPETMPIKRKFNSILDEYRFTKQRKIYEKLCPPLKIRLPSKKYKKKKRTTSTTETQTDPSITEMFECCRHVPYNGMRKERNWFYFYMHQCRDFLPRIRRTTALVDLNKCRSQKLRSSRSLKMPSALQFRSLKNDPPLLTLNKSNIHRIGVFADENLNEGTFLIEYVGESIRNALVEKREQQYRQKGFGSYMFRLDSKFTIDATLKGCIARFINHSCEPNCVAKIVSHDHKKHIILLASKNIRKGEEICYDYKMPKENEKMPCLCNTSSCRKFIN